MRKAWILLVLIAQAIPAFALDPRKALTQYSRTVWTQQNGLPQDDITALAQTADGYLWVGTTEGLARFDGYEFVTFDQERGKLPSNNITALASAADGSLWIGTPAGLVHYKDRQFRRFSRSDGLVDDAISSLSIDAAGSVWIVAGERLSRYDGSKFINFSPDEEAQIGAIRAIVEDGHGSLYVAGYNSVRKIENGKLVKAISPDPMSLGSGSKRVAARSGLEVGKGGDLWILTMQDLVELTPDRKIKQYSARDGLPDSFGLFGTLREDREGTLWAGTGSGLARLKAGRFEALSETAYHERLSVNCIFEDREGNLWVGGNQGLTRLRDDIFTVYGKSEGLPSDSPSVVYEDKSGRTWVGFVDAGFALFDRARGSSTPVSAPVSNITSIRETRSGQLLVAARNGLWVGGTSGRFIPTYRTPTVRGATTYDAMEGADGRIWLALASGLGELQGDKVQIRIPGGPAIESWFVTLAQGTDGTIWGGTMSGGLWSLNGDRKRLYTTADGLGNDHSRTLYQEPSGTLWIGTLGGGLIALDHGKFSRFTAKDGLLSDNVVNIIDDGDSLWLSTTGGICRIAKRDLWDFAAGRATVLRPINYGVASGLRSVQGFPLNSGGHRHSDGSLWFTTTRGIAIYDPRPKTPSFPLTPLVEMSVDGQEQEASQARQIPPGSARLQFRYGTIYLRAPESVQYSYRLDGVDSDWVRGDPRRLVNYNRLPHGHYRFRLKAELPGGPSTEGVYELDLLPHVYETAWFRSLLALVLAGLVWMAYRFRERQVRSRYALVLGERARLAREVHDTLAQGFAGLCSQLDAIAFRLPDDVHSATEYLELARRMARHSLTEARRALMDLRATALDDQDLAAALESGVRLWTNNSGLDTEIDAGGGTSQLPEHLAHHILRIAQEAVTNAVKHSGGSKIWINLFTDSEKVTLKVRDDGRGFEYGDVFTTSNGHFGLIGMRERAERLQGELHIESHSGQGTSLNITVPLR